MNYAVSSRRTPHILHLITCPLILFIMLIMIWRLLWGENINAKARDGVSGAVLYGSSAADAQTRTSRLGFFSSVLIK